MKSGVSKVLLEQPSTSSLTSPGFLLSSKLQTTEQNWTAADTGPPPPYQATSTVSQAPSKVGQAPPRSAQVPPPPSWSVVNSQSSSVVTNVSTITVSTSSTIIVSTNGAAEEAVDGVGRVDGAGAVGGRVGGVGGTEVVGMTKMSGEAAVGGRGSGREGGHSPDGQVIGREGQREGTRGRVVPGGARSRGVAGGGVGDGGMEQGDGASQNETEGKWDYHPPLQSPKYAPTVIHMTRGKNGIVAAIAPTSGDGGVRGWSEASSSGAWLGGTKGGDREMLPIMENVGRLKETSSRPHSTDSTDSSGYLSSLSSHDQTHSANQNAALTNATVTITDNITESHDVINVSNGVTTTSFDARAVTHLVNRGYKDHDVIDSKLYRGKATVSPAKQHGSYVAAKRGDRKVGPTPCSASLSSSLQVSLSSVPRSLPVSGATPASLSWSEQEKGGGDVEGSTISCHNLCLDVKISPSGSRCARKNKKEILRDVNGVFKPGMNAILGPTGGGKTSLLDVLAGSKGSSGKKGHVLVDGRKQPKNFKCLTGYVVQDDVVMGTLTIRENFMFSANLRLPRSVTREVKITRVNETIQELGLNKCADSKVGTEFIRGVSGGERKRTNIGMELIISPKVLFLDEPTTGLDASTANSVMSVLRKLSLRGRTVIFSIHQPRYSIYKLFDRVMLLAAGRTVYHGPANQALPYFNSIGYECERHNNPADFFLDVVSGDVASCDVRVSRDLISRDDLNENNNWRDEDISEPRDRWTSNMVSINSHRNSHLNNHQNGSPTEDICGSGCSPGNLPASQQTVEILATKYEQSTWCLRVREQLSPILTDYLERQQNGSELSNKEGDYANGFWTQLNYLCQRTCLNILRNPQTSVMQLVIVIIFALIVGIIYLHVGDNILTAIQNRAGMMFFIIVNQMFSNLSAVELFIKERVIFLHENASGYYRVSSYFVAKFLCDVIPLRVIPLIFFTVISYFMIGLQMSAGKFFIFFLTLFLTNMASTGIGFMISASVSVLAIANLFVSLSYIIMMVFGGLLVNITTMPVWLSWIQNLSIIRYSLNALLINELNDITLFYYNGTVPVEGDTTAGPDYLTTLGISHSTDWDLWSNEMALGIYAIVMMILAYVVLRINIHLIARKR